MKREQGEILAGVCLRAFAGFVLASHGHSNTGDCFVAVTIFPGKVIFVLLGAAEENVLRMLVF